MATPLNGSGVSLTDLSTRGGMVRYVQTERTSQQSVGSGRTFVPHMTLSFRTDVTTNAMFIFNPGIIYESGAVTAQSMFYLNGKAFGNPFVFGRQSDANSGITAQHLEPYNNLPAGQYNLAVYIRNNDVTPGYTAYDAYGNPYWVPETFANSTLITPYLWGSAYRRNILVAMIFGESGDTGLSS
jgi:hypothetical protein